MGFLNGSDFMLSLHLQSHNLLQESCVHYISYNIRPSSAFILLLPQCCRFLLVSVMIAFLSSRQSVPWHPTTHNSSQPHPVYTSEPISQSGVTRGHAFPTVDWICYHRFIWLLCSYVQSSASTTHISTSRRCTDKHVIVDTHTHKLQEGKGYEAEMYHPCWHGLFTQAVVGLLSPTLLSCVVAIFLHWMAWM